MGRAMRAIAIVAVITAGSARAGADPVRVELAGAGVPVWQADAVAHALAADLEDARFHAVVVRGTLAPDSLSWTIVVAGAVVKHGDTELRGTEVRAVAGAIKSEIGRVLQPGEGARKVAELPAQVGAAEPLAVGALGLVAIFLLIPFVRGRGIRGGRAFRRTIAVIAGLGLLAVALIVATDYEWSWAVYVGGGLAWGGFVAVLLPVMFPALPGLDRVEYTELVGVLARWAVLSLQRIAAVTLAYAPFMAALALACVLLDVPRGIALAVAVPAWGLCVRLWWQAWVEVIATRLDRELVEHEPTTDNPWHAAVHGYFMGYVRRAGWAADDRLLDDIRFLPGTGPDVITYGGGTTHARIVVPRAMLELALAPYGRPHDYAAPRVSTLHWTLWNAGLVVPTEVGAVTATREQRQPRTVAVEGDVEAIVLGEPATFAGIVEPTALDPRPSYHPHEDPLWLDYDAGEEFDGTDAGDKDFLFGVLVHELGRIRRHEDRTATLRLAAHRWLQRRPRLAQPIARIERALARQVDAVGDDHVGLNFARDHYIQYLAWRIWQREDVTTARAFAPELHRQTRVLARMVGGADAGEASPGRATSEAERDTALEAWGRDTGGAPDLRARIARLARTRTTTARGRRWRRLALAAVALAAAGGAAIAVARAVDYHATYQARIKPATESSHGEGK